MESEGLARAGQPLLEGQALAGDASDASRPRASAPVRRDTAADRMRDAVSRARAHSLGPHLGHSLYQLGDESAGASSSAAPAKPQDDLGQAGLKRWLFALLCWMSFSFSGGVVLGVGPLMSKMASQGYFSAECGAEPLPCPGQFDQMSSMFNGGFQILTWGSVGITLALPKLGPRLSAACGAVLASGAAGLFWRLPKNSAVTGFMIAYGLLAVGMNAVYVSLMSGLVGMYQDLEFRCSLLSGLFNAAGAIMMIALAPGCLDLQADTLFMIYMFYGLVVLGLVLVVFPPVPYGPNDLVSFARAPVFWEPAEQLEAGEEWLVVGDSKSGLEPTVPALESKFYELTLTGAIRKPRFWWFVTAFGWCTCIAVVVGGQFNIIASDKDGNNEDLWTTYLYPLIGNVCTAVWSPLVGRLASRYGLWMVGLFMLMAAQLLCIGCYLPGGLGLSVILISYSFLNAFAYALQFTYVSVSFPTSLYCPLLALTMAAQGVIGFIAWPGLSPDPFGTTAYKMVILVVGIPSFVFYGFPYIQRQNDKYRTNFLNIVLARNAAADVLKAFELYDRDKSGQVRRLPINERSSGGAAGQVRDTRFSTRHVHISWGRWAF